MRHIKFGEGDYRTTEKLIRELLTKANPGKPLPAATGTADDTPDTAMITRETYLGSTKRVNFAGFEDYTAGAKTFTYPAQQPQDTFVLNGDWPLTSQHITPTASTGQVKLDYHAKEVRMVLSGSGSGTVTYTAKGQTKTIQVNGTPNSYQLLSTQDIEAGTVDVTVGAGVQAFSFTFG